MARIAGWKKTIDDSKGFHDTGIVVMAWEQTKGSAFITIETLETGKFKGYYAVKSNLFDGNFSETLHFADAKSTAIMIMKDNSTKNYDIQAQEALKIDRGNIHAIAKTLKKELNYPHVSVDMDIPDNNAFNNAPVLFLFVSNDKKGDKSKASWVSLKISGFGVVENYGCSGFKMRKFKAKSLAHLIQKINGLKG